MDERAMRAYRLRRKGLYIVVVALVVLIEGMFRVDDTLLLPFVILFAIILPDTQRSVSILRAALGFARDVMLLIILLILAAWLYRTFDLDPSMALCAVMLAAAIFCLTWAEFLGQPGSDGKTNPLIERLRRI